MPEGPQVQIVRRCLQEMLLHPKPKKIKNIKVFYPNIIKDPTPDQFINKLLGQKFTRIDRYGKHLIIKLQNYSIISHLRMEGKYMLRDKDFVPEKHDHIQFLLTDGTSLFYNDVRKFGTMYLVKKGEEYNHRSIAKLGPEVNNEATFTPEYLTRVCQKSQRSIKEFLLDQEVVCGLGNIYVDQTLFMAHVHPQRQCNRLSAKETKDICIYSKLIIDAAIDGKGTTIKSFSSNHGQGQFQDMLKVYGRQGQKCQKCNQSIKKIKLGGRGTHFCQKCQK